MKDHNKNKDPSNLINWNLNSLCGQQMSCKLSVDGFEWVEKTPQFNKDFTKNYIEDSEVSEYLFHF